jgi:hypothetical protein
MSIVLKDWQGTEYTVGSRIVYVNGDSYGNRWRPGVVEDIVENPDYNGWGRDQFFVMFRDDKNPDGRPSKLSNLSKIMAL